MDIKELMAWAEAQNARLKRHFDYRGDDEKWMMAKAVKLTEEVGELCDEVLAHSSLQRVDKVDGHEKENLPKEVADVLICTLLLAQSMGVDVEAALKARTEQMTKRFGTSRAV